MRTPKESFLQSGHAAAFEKIAGTACFEAACEASLLQLLFEMPASHSAGMPTDPYVGLDANSQMCGARRVLAILLDLPSPVKPPSPDQPTELHYDH